MGKKILFTFAGTGDSAENRRATSETGNYAPDVVRIYFSGSHKSKIGGRSDFLGSIDPNLDVIASKIRTCFNDKGELSIAELHKKFGKEVIICGVDDINPIAVDSIYLSGFSRGAVTTFAAARHLDDLNIPMTLNAQDPVPGDSTFNEKNKSSEYSKNKDLTKVTNLKRAEVILGQYSKDINAVHNTYFKQMAPNFNETCSTTIYLGPEFSHFHPSTIANNQVEAFYFANNITKRKTLYHEGNDSLFFVPKLLQQKFHTGLDARAEPLPRYVENLWKTVCAQHSDCEESSVKVLQAVYALDQATPRANLYELVKNDSTDEGIMVREFIVESENIIQYYLRDQKDPIVTSALTQFREEMYRELQNLLINKRTPQADLQFTANCEASLAQISKESKLPQVSAFKASMSTYLGEKVLFHPELARDLDENNPCKSYGRPSEQNSISQQKKYKETIQKLSQSDEQPLEKTTKFGL